MILTIYPDFQDISYISVYMSYISSNSTKTVTMPEWLRTAFMLVFIKQSHGRLKWCSMHLQILIRWNHPAVCRVIWADTYLSAQADLGQNINLLLFANFLYTGGLFHVCGICRRQCYYAVFWNHARYFVQNQRKYTLLTSISVWEISVSIALKYDNEQRNSEINWIGASIIGIPFFFFIKNIYSRYSIPLALWYVYTTIVTWLWMSRNQFVPELVRPLAFSSRLLLHII